MGLGQRLEQGTYNSREAFALVFTVLHILADTTRFSPSRFSGRRAELRSFAAKNSETVESTVKNHARLSEAAF